MPSVPRSRFWRRPLDYDESSHVRGVVRIREERCKGCAYCVEYCPRDVLQRSDRFNLKGYHPPDVVNGESCAACGLCELLCPEFAVHVREEITEVAHAR